jgi:hypothetical protein
MRKGLSHHLPDVVRPLKTVCFQVEVPDDPWYLRAWFGTFFELASARSWDDDPDHTALEVARVWLEIALKLKSGCAPALSVAGTDGGDDYMIRQNPDNPCLLESSVDGMTWCTWADLSKCLVANPSQPTGGGQPAAGECREWDATLDANGQWLLPVQVNPGDKITVSGPQGGWTDGGGNWYCPNGQGYTFGLCSGVGGLNPADPLPTALHMCILGESNATYYDALAGVIGIPTTDPANQNFTFQANDASLSDNFGNIKFHVKFCAASASPIAITYDYGSGPASANVGDIVVITSEHNGPNNAQVCVFHLSPCSTITVLGGSGFLPHVAAGDWWDYDDCASVNHTSGAPTSGTVLTDFPAHTALERLELAGEVSSVFTMTIRIES